MKQLKLIKKLDLFSLPVYTFFSSRDKKQNKKSYHLYHGSIAGGVLTILFILVLLGNLTSIILKMFSRELDNTKSSLQMNEMKNTESNVADLFASNFMTSIQIKPMDIQ